MTSKEFVLWLRGFLDGISSTEPHKDFIIDKMDTIVDPIIDKMDTIVDPTDIPYINFPPTPIDCCPSGGEHEYPLTWHGTIPPPCTKCGKSQTNFNINCTY